MENVKPNSALESEIESLRHQLDEAKETIEAIRNGEIDALVVQGKNGHELYTLSSADHTYRVFIEKMTEGAVTLNRDGVIVYCNSSFAHMVGEPSRYVIAELFETFVCASDKRNFNLLVEEGWSVDRKGEICLLQNSEIIPVQLSITSITLEDGNYLSILVTDLTVQKRILNTLKSSNEQLESMNVALELSNHDLQQFASVASHDLQEPLRKILVFSHLLREKAAQELTENSSLYVNKIVSAANRMKVLIVDILNYSRLSANDQDFVKTDLKATILELLEDLELKIKDKRARISIQDMPVVEINRGQMRQVFQNLISNALKFSKKDVAPVIDIYCTNILPEFVNHEKLEGPYCHIHIKDNGIGFDEKYARSIFNLFEKLHSKDDYEGTGIGLAITKKIIEKHSGFINVISKIGFGAEFIISLPLNQNGIAEYPHYPQ